MIHREYTSYYIFYHRSERGKGIARAWISKPSVGAVVAVDALAAVSFAGGAIDAMKRLPGGDGGGFPSLDAPLSDRDGECRWKLRLRSTSCPKPASPHLYLCAV
jgi:hypothetical protein